jgi:hypothetical protein
VVSGSTLTPLVLASIFFVARIFAKSSGLAGGWGWDDYTIIVSYVSQSFYRLTIGMLTVGSSWVLRFMPSMSIVS